MAAYQKKWRLRTAELLALAESSSSDEQAEDKPDSDTESANPSNHEEEGLSATFDRIMDQDLRDDIFAGMLSSDSDTDDVYEDIDINLQEAQGNSEISEELVNWATKHGCSRSALNEMLEMLRRHGHRLPKDARTLLKTPRTVTSVDKCNGQYAYFGIESGVLQILAHRKYQLEHESINLSFNIDGVPLFVSTKDQFWPILCTFLNYEPFLVALYFGRTKPDPVQDYLADFIDEWQRLAATGITYGDRNYEIKLKAFICDAPARAYIKCVKGHVGYYSCERCIIQGTWKKRVVFNSTDNFPRRCSQDFKNLLYEDHQIGISPLINADIPCIEPFALDYMHLVCLGVMKRILVFLTGTFTDQPKACRLSKQQQNLVSSRLQSFNGLMPSEFARQPRPLAELDRWKATELRQFLL